MKKRAMAFLFTLMLLGSVMLTAVAYAETMYVNTSNGKSLNIRDYPSKDGNVIGTFAYGASVEVDTGFVGGTWAHVYFAGGDGYCMYRYLSDYHPGPKPQPTSTAKPSPATDLYSDIVQASYTVAVRPSSPGGFVHLRWAPSKKQPVNRDYYNGDTLQVLAQNGEWCQVYDAENGVCGFMMVSFLTAVN